MTISFYGGAQTVTGSKHLITLENGKRILLDCGMFQQGKSAAKKNRSFLFVPDSVNYLILSHAHIDHSGLIPFFVKKGFHGKIFATAPTIELTQLLLSDTAKIQRMESKDNLTPGMDTSPLFSEDDLSQAMKMFIPIPYNKRYNIDEDIELLFTEAGHILGSAVVNLTIKENDSIKAISFSGDIGRYTNRILKTPEKFPQAEFIICESTYGSHIHKSIEKTEERLLRIIEEVCVKNRGKLLIPAFSVGRTQELIFSLNKLSEVGKLPDVPVFVDSPMGVYATKIVRDNMDYFNKEMKKYMEKDPDPFDFPNLTYITSHDQSSLIQSAPNPYIVISSSGMMEAGRILQHLRYSVEDKKNGILLTGFAGEDTLGGKIASGQKKVWIMNELYEVKAKVFKLQEYSAHADRNDIVQFLSCQDKNKVKKIFLVHGQPKTQKKLKDTLFTLGYKNVEVAMPRIHYPL